MDEHCAETPVRDNVKAAVELMAQGARMVLSDIPGDSSMLSMSCSGNVSKGVAAALADAQAEIARLRGELAEWRVAGQYADDQLRRLGSDGYASGLTGLLARAGA